MLCDFFHCWLGVDVMSQVVVGSFSIACYNNFLNVGLDIASAAFFASEVVVNLKCLLTSSSMLFRLRCEC